MLKDEWEFNILGIYNYKVDGHLKYYFNLCKKIALSKDIDGDFCEFGVHKGKSILALGLMLKEVGSDKKIFGFDTWDGFPSIDHENDQFNKWDDLINESLIDNEHYKKIKKNYNYIKFLKNNEVIDPGKLSTSGDFSNCSIEELEKKINFLKLDNIVLIKGNFSETLKNNSNLPENVCAALIDCDLYEGYMASLSWLYNKIHKDSAIYLDEYYSLKFPGARIAVNEFLKNKTNLKLSKWGKTIGGFERWGITFKV